MTVYVPIEKIRKAWRNVFANEDRVDDTVNAWHLVKQIEKVNRMQVHGAGNHKLGVWYHTDGLEFDDEKAYLEFLLRWG